MINTSLKAGLALAAMSSLCALASANGDIIGKVETATGTPIVGAVVNLTTPISIGSGTAEMTQKGKEFVPHVLVIQQGTTVKFQNEDPFFHNVFSSSHSKTFNVSQTKKGDTSEIKFDKIGIIPIKCHIHANMKAYIVVCPNQFFATTNEKGLFRISDIPAGTYTIKMWSASGASSTQTIDVPSSGNAKIIFKV